MPILVSSESMLECSFGKIPSPLTVLPVNRVMDATPAANIMDHIPLVNIMTFGMCTAPTNPAVILAGGSPVPCVPVTPVPWVPGADTVLLGGMPALDNVSKCLCTWLGVIQVVAPLQETVMVP